MQIVNVTDTDLTIEAKVPLGIGYPVKPDSQMECAAILMYELEELISPEVVGEVNVLPGEANNRKLPDIDLSKSDLTTEQVGQAQELISELRDVFSKDRRDYGRTSLLTHSINTGGAAPIKKTPYSCTCRPLSSTLRKWPRTISLNQASVHGVRRLLWPVKKTVR